MRLEVGEFMLAILGRRIALWPIIAIIRHNAAPTPLQAYRSPAIYILQPGSDAQARRNKTERTGSWTSIKTG